MPETQRPCPNCQKPATTDFRPFCSLRCRQVDLGRWLTGSYAIPAFEPPDEDFGLEGEENNG